MNCNDLDNLTVTYFRMPWVAYMSNNTCTFQLSNCKLTYFFTMLTFSSPAALNTFTPLSLITITAWYSWRVLISELCKY